MKALDANLNFLSRIGPENAVLGSVPCVALVHNEMNILSDFLEHYRSLGIISFLIVDDHSDDGSRDYLLEQNDVTLFSPRKGSTYTKHKRVWRSELLDSYAANLWCLAPDIDEHFVYGNIENKSLANLIEELEFEGAEAFHATMVDMYADKPLSEHKYAGGGLARSFPLFDDARGYRMLPAPKRFRRQYPTPFLMVFGGMRERLFIGTGNQPTRLQRYLLDRFAGMEGPINPGPKRRAGALLTRRMTRNLFSHEPFTCTKLPLLKWRKGMGFSGGSHAVSAPLKLSSHSGALLHYKFTRGVTGLNYIAERGQHAGGAIHYRRILEQRELLNLSPVSTYTTCFTDSASLGLLVR